MSVSRSTLLAVGHVQHAAGHAGGVGGQQVGLDGVAHVAEIARLPPVAVDHRLPAGEHGRDEQRDHGRVGAVGVLPRPENVEVAQGDGFESVGGGECLAVKFRGQLGGGIRGQRGDRVGLAFAAVRAGRRRRRWRRHRPPAAPRPAGPRPRASPSRWRRRRGPPSGRSTLERHRGQGRLVKDAIDARGPPRPRRAASRMSPSMNSMRSRKPSMLDSRPVLRLSSTRTRSPRATNASAMWEPMKPAPPVTRKVRMRMVYSVDGGGALSTWPHYLESGFRCQGIDGRDGNGYEGLRVFRFGRRMATAGRALPTAQGEVAVMSSLPRKRFRIGHPLMVVVLGWPRSAVYN